MKCMRQESLIKWLLSFFVRKSAVELLFYIKALKRDALIIYLLSDKSTAVVFYHHFDTYILYSLFKSSLRIV